MFVGMESRNDGVELGEGFKTCETDESMTFADMTVTETKYVQCVTTLFFKRVHFSESTYCTTKTQLLNMQ